MIKKMLYVVVALLIVVAVSGCVELAFNSKGHLALGVPKGKITKYVEWGDSRYTSKEVVNYVPDAPIVVVAPDVPQKTKTVPVFNTNNNANFASFGD